MVIPTNLAILNSMSNFVPKDWLNWQILVAISSEFLRQRNLMEERSEASVTSRESTFENLDRDARVIFWGV